MQRVLAILLLCLVPVPATAAVVYFQEDFNKPDTDVLGIYGWGDIDPVPPAVRIRNGQLLMGGFGAAAFVKYAYHYVNLSPYGITTATLAYDWNGFIAGTGDVLEVSWSETSNAFGYTLLASHNLGNPIDEFRHATATLFDPGGLNFFYVRFQIKSNSSGHTVSIDNVVVSSVPEPGTAVPEPPTLGLIGLGLLGLGAMMARRRRYS